MFTWLDGPNRPTFLIDILRSHTDTTQSTRLLSKNYPSVADTSVPQHTTPTRDRHPCSRRNSKPQSQQVSGPRPTSYTAPPPASERPNIEVKCVTGRYFCWVLWLIKRECNCINTHDGQACWVLNV